MQVLRKLDLINEVIDLAIMERKDLTFIWESENMKRYIALAIELKLSIIALPPFIDTTFFGISLHDWIKFFDSWNDDFLYIYIDLIDKWDPENAISAVEKLKSKIEDLKNKLQAEGEIEEKALQQTQEFLTEVSEKLDLVIKYLKLGDKDNAKNALTSANEIVRDKLRWISPFWEVSVLGLPAKDWIYSILYIDSGLALANKGWLYEKYSIGTLEDAKSQKEKLESQLQQILYAE